MSTFPTAADIKQRAERAGLSIVQLCREAGVAPSVLNRWAAGKSATTRNVERLTNALVKHEESVQ